MSYRIFTLSPGSTSTKVAVFEDDKCLFKSNIVHNKAVLDGFDQIKDQRPFRVGAIMDELHAHGFRLREMDAFSAYSGGIESTIGGVYTVNERMLEDSASGRIAEHPATLGAQIVGEFADALGKPAFVVNPPDCDEFEDIARISGIKGIYRQSHVHVTNQKEVAMRAAASLGKKYEECNFVVCHVGGGLSIVAHKKGLMVDGNDVLNGEGPMAPNRSGYIPLTPIIKRCYKEGATYREMKELICKRGGLKSLMGTDDILEIKAKRDEGDQWAKLVYEAFAYNLAKYIGSYACVLQGQVDAIVMTGGVSRDEEFIENLKKYAGWIAPFIVYGGDFEMEALAAGAIRVLDGIEEPKEYTGKPVWDGFDFEPEEV